MVTVWYILHTFKVDPVSVKHVSRESSDNILQIRRKMDFDLVNNNGASGKYDQKYFMETAYNLGVKGIPGQPLLNDWLKDNDTISLKVESHTFTLLTVLSV